MNPLLFPLFDLGGKIIDRLFPDETAKAAAQLELLKLQQQGDLQQVLEQLRINAVEAAHPSIFVAGWRPFVGWVCGFALAYQSIFHNWLVWFSTAWHFTPPPAPDADTLVYILGTLLGVGAMRTYEKKSGVAK